MTNFNDIANKAVAYALENKDGLVFEGTLDECFERMVNLYGDANVAAMVQDGVKIKRVGS